MLGAVEKNGWFVCAFAGNPYRPKVATINRSADVEQRRQVRVRLDQTGQKRGVRLVRLVAVKEAAASRLPKESFPLELEILDKNGGGNAKSCQFGTLGRKCADFDETDSEAIGPNLEPWMRTFHVQQNVEFRPLGEGDSEKLEVLSRCRGILTKGNTLDRPLRGEKNDQAYRQELRHSSHPPPQ